MQSKQRRSRPILATIAAAAVLATLTVVGRMTMTSSNPTSPHLVSQRPVATIKVGAGPEAVATGSRAVWVLNTGSETLSRIDPASNRVVATIKVGYAPIGVTVDTDAVWVTDPGSHTVARINPANNQVVAIFKSEYNPTGIAADTDAVWVADPISHTLSRIDRVVR
jgi:virginiamycin B lyase